MNGSPWYSAGSFLSGRSRADRGANHVRAVVAGYPGGERRSRRLAMMQAYFDDSGKGQGPVFVIAGYVSTAERWEAFSDDWEQALQEFPPIEYFKMREAASLQDQFRGFDEGQRNQRVNRLNEIIAKHALYGVICCIGWQDYADVFKGQIAR